MEPPRTDGVGGVGCPPCTRDGDGSVFLPFSSLCKKETVAAQGGGVPRSPACRGHGKGGGGYAGVSAVRLSVSPSLVGLWDERSVLSVASSSSSHRS